MQQAKAWRLRKTLARKLQSRPIEAEDVKYAWAAYQMGDLRAVFPGDMNAAKFKQEFTQLVLSRFDAAWTLFAETNKGFIPAGMSFGFWPHKEATHFLILNTMVWFPWASSRNRIESATGFFNSVGREIPMMGFARDRDKKFMATLAKHGVIRRIGTAGSVFPDGQASVWETRHG